MTAICSSILLLRFVSLSSDLVVWFSTAEKIFCFFALITAIKLSTIFLNISLHVFASLYELSVIFIKLTNYALLCFQIVPMCFNHRFDLNLFVFLLLLGLSSLCGFLWPNVTQVWQTAVSQSLQKNFSSSSVCPCLGQNTGRFNTSS